MPKNGKLNVSGKAFTTAFVQQKGSLVLYIDRFSPSFFSHRFPQIPLFPLFFLCPKPLIPINTMANFAVGPSQGSEGEMTGKKSQRLLIHVS